MVVKMRTKKYKPKARSFSCGGYDLVYKCGKCNSDFGLADYKSWKFCPICGTPIDWGVIITANAEIKEKYLAVIDSSEEAEKIMAVIDEVNKTIPEGVRQQMKQTKKTKQQILRSNIRYYTNQGWTKEELLREGFFTQEQFDLAEADDVEGEI